MSEFPTEIEFDAEDEQEYAAQEIIKNGANVKLTIRSAKHAYQKVYNKDGSVDEDAVETPCLNLQLEVVNPDTDEKVPGVDTVFRKIKLPCPSKVFPGFVPTKRMKEDWQMWFNAMYPDRDRKEELQAFKEVWGTPDDLKGRQVIGTFTHLGKDGEKKNAWLQRVANMDKFNGELTPVDALLEKLHAQDPEEQEQAQASSKNGKANGKAPAKKAKGR